MHALLERVEQSAQGVRKLGRDLRQAVILLGDTDPDQIARRVDLIHGVSRSLEHAGTLLLVPTRTDAHERSRLLQLFGWVVAELQRGLSIRLLLPHSPEALGVAAAQAVAAGHVALPLPAVA